MTKLDLILSGAADNNGYSVVGLNGEQEVEIIRIYDEEDEGLGSAGKVAIVLVIALIIISIGCVVFCRFWKKENDDHYRRMATEGIKLKQKQQEEEKKRRAKITLKKNKDDDFVNIEASGMTNSKMSTATERSVGQPEQPKKKGFFKKIFSRKKNN